MFAIEYSGGVKSTALQSGDRLVFNLEKGVLCIYRGDTTLLRAGEMVVHLGKDIIEAIFVRQDDGQLTAYIGREILLPCFLEPTKLEHAVLLAKCMASAAGLVSVKNPGPFVGGDSIISFSLLSFEDAELAQKWLNESRKITPASAG